eukprot:7729528-Heterocapsa_arctica.AAC.1
MGRASPLRHGLATRGPCPHAALADRTLPPPRACEGLGPTAASPSSGLILLHFLAPEALGPAALPVGRPLLGLLGYLGRTER